MKAKLYCFGESGNAYKCALALALADLPWEPVFVDFFNGETRSPKFRAINPMGEVPVLIDGDETLTQSGNILYHIAGRTGRFLAPGEDKECWRWVLWDAHKLSSQIGTARFLSNFVPPEKRPEAVIDFLRARLDRRTQRHGRRSRLLRLPLLPGAVRLRSRGMARDRPVAEQDRRPARLAPPL
jgi:glutathione S-transferase